MFECTFCAVAKDVEPSRKIAQSEHFLAVMDVAPMAPGETIILSKGHYRDIFDLPEEYGSELLQFIRRVASTMMVVTEADGFNLVINNGIPAGQQIFHSHLHIIPRRRDDQLKIPLGTHRLIPIAELDAQQQEFQKLYDSAGKT